MNCKKRFLGLVLSMTTLVGTLALTTNASDSVKSAVGIVDASALRLREGPGTDTEILTTAYRNDYVVILESEGDWYKVIYNLREGYMHSDYLTVKERENVELGYGEVNTYLVNLRSGPTTSSEILDQLAEGEDAYIIGFNCGWYKVTFGGDTGYIRSDLLELTQAPVGNSGGSMVEVVSLGQQVVDLAQNYLGYPYVWGGSTPSGGFDCSGFVKYVYAQMGYTLNRVAADQMLNGSAVTDLELGDLVFFNNTYTTGAAASHVGIYIGDNQFIHAADGGVKITSLSNTYYSSRYVGARRIL